MLPSGEFSKRDLQGAYTKWGVIQVHSQFLITPLVSEPGKIYIRELSSRNQIYARDQTHFQLTNPSLLETLIAYIVKHILEEKKTKKEEEKRWGRGGKLTHPACG